MRSQSLEKLLQTVGSPVDLARNSQIGPYVYPSVPSEFTNWRDEQHAWRDTCCLFDQSYHMTDMYIKGPDSLRLLGDLGVNSFDGFAVNKAKQFVACNYDGYVIGDAILFYLDDELFNLVGRPSAHNWSTGRLPRAVRLPVLCQTGRRRLEEAAPRVAGRDAQRLGDIPGRQHPATRPEAFLEHRKPAHRGVRA